MTLVATLSRTLRRSLVTRAADVKVGRPAVGRRAALASTLLVATTFACSQPKEDPAPGASAAPSAPTAPSGSASAPPPSVSTASPVPVGPELVVVPGVGISAIRFGATFETLERHMTSRCEVRTETRCVFVDQAVEFTMKDGVAVGMKVHRRGRPVEGVPGRLYGFFKGFTPPAIQLGLHRHVVHEEIRAKLERTEELSVPGGPVAREYYPGLVIEYDLLPNGNVVAGSFEVLRLPQTERVPVIQGPPRK